MILILEFVIMSKSYKLNKKSPLVVSIPHLYVVLRMFPLYFHLLCDWLMFVGAHVVLYCTQLHHQYKIAATYCTKTILDASSIEVHGLEEVKSITMIMSWLYMQACLKRISPLVVTITLPHHFAALRKFVHLLHGQDQLMSVGACVGWYCT